MHKERGRPAYCMVAMVLLSSNQGSRAYGKSRTAVGQLTFFPPKGSLPANLLRTRLTSRQIQRHTSFSMSPPLFLFVLTLHPTTAAQLSRPHITSRLRSTKALRRSPGRGTHATDDPIPSTPIGPPPRKLRVPFYSTTSASCTGTVQIVPFANFQVSL